jgi:branched-chain amino acid transport system substrate-binding protein
MRPRYLPALALAALLVGACGGTPDQSQAKPSAYSLGANLCLSGVAAQNGEKMRMGTDLAVKAINDRGGIGGVPLKVFYEDSKADPQLGVEAFNKLTSIEKVPVTTVCGSSILLATVASAEKKHILLLNASASSPRLIGASKYLFSNIIYSNQELNVLMDLLISKNLKSVCLYVVNDDSGNGMKDYLQAEFPKKGGSIKCSEFHTLTTTDHSSQIAKIKQAKPDAVLALTYGQLMVSFMRQASNLGLDVPMFSWSGVEGQALLGIGKASDGLTYTAPYYNLQATDARTKEFMAAFNSQYPGMQPHFFTISYYEATLIWADITRYTVDHHMAYNGESLRQAVLKVKTFDGIGGKITLRDDGTVGRQVAIKQIQNNQFTLVQVAGS